MNPTRRQVLLQGAATAGALAFQNSPAPRPSFDTADTQLQKVYDAALAQLETNTRVVQGYSEPVLIEGGVYGGIWLECGPLEGLVYAPFQREVARANHDVFFHHQRDDGYLPCWVRIQAIGSAQIQMVVPIAATAYELWQRNGDREFLTRAYNACSRWDDWLVKYRDTRKTGLCEAFCEYDTGHDNSPRFHGLPKRCRDGDARYCPESDVLPYLAPDLSATVYGGRVALANIAAALDRPGDARKWGAKAEAIRKTIIQRLYVPEDGCFYDVDARDKFVKIRGDVLSRVLSEHVVNQRTFDEIYRKQIHNPQAFWPAYPLPSIAMDDPAYVPPGNRNSWGGPSQALTALRAPRWIEHYGKYSDLRHLMSQWVSAIAQNGGFLQQLDPLTGEFTKDQGGYSPAALVLLDFVWRLHGIRESPEGLEWNCRGNETRAEMPVKDGTATLETSKGRSVLIVAGKAIAEVRGECRLMTGPTGRLMRVIGTGASANTIQITVAGKTRTLQMKPDSVVTL